MIDCEEVLDVCDLFDFVHKSINKISGPLFLVFNETSDSLCIYFFDKIEYVSSKFEWITGEIFLIYNVQHSFFGLKMVINFQFACHRISP